VFHVRYKWGLFVKDKIKIEIWQVPHQKTKHQPYLQLTQRQIKQLMPCRTLMNTAWLLITHFIKSKFLEAD